MGALFRIAPHPPQKTLVYDFLSKELSCLTPSAEKSTLFERYYRSEASIAGESFH